MPIERQLVLADGRTVGLTEHGDPDGGAVFVAHGTPASRLGHEFLDEPARERRLRIVCFDRPGIGLSDPVPERRIADGARDTGALADALGVDRFSVLGYSCGAPYALACSAVLGERVHAIAILAGVGPLDRDGAAAELSSTDRRLVRTAVHRPLLARAELAATALVLRHAPRLALRGFMNELGDSDRVALAAMPGALDFAVEAFRQGTSGVLADYRAWGSDWGFALEDVDAPVLLLHGDDDRLVGLGHPRDLASRLPNATLEVLPGIGHMSVQAHAGRALAALATS